MRHATAPRVCTLVANFQEISYGNFIHKQSMKSWSVCLSHDSIAICAHSEILTSPSHHCVLVRFAHYWIRAHVKCRLVHRVLLDYMSRSRRCTLFIAGTYHRLIPANVYYSKSAILVGLSPLVVQNTLYSFST